MKMMMNNNDYNATNEYNNIGQQFHSASLAGPTTTTTTAMNDSIEKVILGEAMTLSTFILKNNQRLTKANYIQLSRMTSMIIEYEIECNNTNDDDNNNNNNNNEQQWLQMVDPLLKNLILLRCRLIKQIQLQQQQHQQQSNNIDTLDASYFKPFCDVIINKDVSGPVTGLALQSIQKFLNYGFVKDNEIVHLISESVTKARFVGTDSNSDEAVLMTILSVLESLIVMPFYSLTNGIICEIMQSCFRIAFEMRLSELLRKCAVKSLTEMVRALFARISFLQEKINHKNVNDYNNNNDNNNNNNNATNVINNDKNNRNASDSNYDYYYHDKNNASFHKLNRMGKRFLSTTTNGGGRANAVKHDQNIVKKSKTTLTTSGDLTSPDSYIEQSYGLACIHELLSYLTSLINPLPDGQNTEYMINVGLQLLTIIFEISVDDIGTNYCLLSVVKTDLCWNIMQLINNEKNLNTFTSVLRLAFLIFKDLRMHLKYQFETFLLRLMDIISTFNLPLEFRDICMEYLLQFFHHIPYLPHELFFNYDCDPYAMNIMEDLLQLLSKNCFSSTTNNSSNQNVPASTTSLSLSFTLNFNALQILSFKMLLSNLRSLQMAELSNDKNIYLIANPATMIVNISNIRDLTATAPSAAAPANESVPVAHHSIETNENKDNDEDDNNNNNETKKDDIDNFEICGEADDNHDDDNNVDLSIKSTIEEFNNVIIDMNQQLDYDCDISATIVTTDTSPSNNINIIGGDNDDTIDNNNNNDNFQSNEKLIEKQIEFNNNDDDDDVIEQSEQKTTTINKYFVTYLFPEKFDIIKNEQIDALKKRKSLLWIATDKFNQKPSKGVEFLYENKLIQNDDDLVLFLRNNSRLDKKPLGEYLSNKKNMTVLSKFVQSFSFKDIRIDEALRLYLESFRLPGEAPLISLVLEQFAHHWHESNGCPFENEDAAFSLAYAIIMLNVDQHNSNVKRQTNPMTCDEFISNLRQVNGGKDFDRNMLTEIYHVIKNNEIIMPAEQQGVVREKYLWKCLLKNSETLSGVYWFHLDSNNVNANHFKNVKNDYKMKLSILNRSIFEISCSPSISTLTLVFDKLNPNRQPNLSKLVLNQGFGCCSLLCANYGQLDNLVENLSKFVIASSPRITTKSELVAYCLFNICKEYANEMRSSWKNIIELILFWYDNKLLDDGLEVDDFALESKKIYFSRKTPLKNQLKQQNEQNQSTFFLSSFYSYFAASNSPLDQDPADNNDCSANIDANDDSNKNLDTNDTDKSASHNQQAPQECNDYCRTLRLIIDESKFLHIDSLIELIKALIQVEFGDTFDDDIEVFKLEMLLKIIFMNRDRLSIFWDYIYRYLIKLMKYCSQSEYLTERIISCIFRLAIRFTSRPDPTNDQIFSLIYQILMYFDPYQIQKKQTALTLHSFISHCNCFLTKNEQWSLIFNLILAISIGYYPANKKLQQPSMDDHNLHNQASISPMDESNKMQSAIYQQQQLESRSLQPLTSNDLNRLSTTYLNVKKNLSDNIFTISAYQYRIMDAEAYEKCMDIMVLIIREYLPNNAKLMCKNDSLNIYEISQMAVGVLCRFVEASIKIQYAASRSSNVRLNKSSKISNKSRLSRLTNALLSSSESDSDDEYQQHQQQQHYQQQNDQQQTNRLEISSVTENVALKLLDLMHYFHLYAPTIVGEQISSDILWNTIWCPLLQALAFFCCDCRRPIRTCAFTFLQRTLLLHDLQVLNAYQWESCFNKVLFPLLSKLLEPINMCDPIGMDETRMRTTNLLCKVFLQHLNPLLSLNTFTALWLTILDFMEKYIKANMQTELVKEAIPESLKNILLVMKTAGCFNETLASITWDRINKFLPNLHRDMIEPEVKQQPTPQQQQQQPPVPQHQSPQQTLPTNQPIQSHEQQPKSNDAQSYHHHHHHQQFQQQQQQQPQQTQIPAPSLPPQPIHQFNQPRFQQKTQFQAIHNQQQPQPQIPSQSLHHQYPNHQYQYDHQQPQQFQHQLSPHHHQQLSYQTQSSEQQSQQLPQQQPIAKNILLL